MSPASVGCKSQEIKLGMCHSYTKSQCDVTKVGHTGERMNCAKIQIMSNGMTYFLDNPY